MSDEETAIEISGELISEEKEEKEATVKPTTVKQTTAKPTAARDAEEDVGNLKIPISRLTKDQKSQLIEKYKTKNNHPYYEIRKNTKGVLTVYKRRKTVQEELEEDHPGLKLTDTQMLQAQVINLERKYAALLGKHKKLKRRVNQIDEETIVMDLDELSKRVEPDEDDNVGDNGGENGGEEVVGEEVVDEPVEDEPVNEEPNEPRKPREPRENYRRERRKGGALSRNGRLVYNFAALKY